MQVEIIPINEICLIEKAIIGIVKSVAPKDALMLSFNKSGKNELKKSEIALLQIKMPNKAA